MAKRFEDYVFDGLGQLGSYDKVLHQLKEVRRHMLRSLPSFRRMRVRTQYQYCVQVVLMVTASVTGQIKRDMPMSPSNDGGGEHDIISGFVPPDVIKIQDVKRIQAPVKKISK